MQNRNKILHPGRRREKGYWEKSGSMIYVTPIDDALILVYDVFCFG